jgi:hypothetical protein
MVVSRRTCLLPDPPLTAARPEPRGSRRATATPGKLPSPNDRTRRAPSRRRIARPLRRRLIGLVDPETNLAARAWNDVGLSPVSVISHCEQARPPYTPRAGGQNRDVLLQDSSLRNRLMLQHNLEPGTPHEAGLWPLPLHPCLAPPSPSIAGRRWLRTSPKRVRARISGRARPRPGRIWSSFRERLTTPFETEPTTPAAHASCRGRLQDLQPRKTRMAAPVSFIRWFAATSPDTFLAFLRNLGHLQWIPQRSSQSIVRSYRHSDRP